MAACTLLIVDDDAVIRGTLRELATLCVDGVVVVGEAANGREAVALARRLNPDVIVMDIRMPVMDGIQATRKIKRELGLSSVVITATSFGHREIERAALAAGASYHLRKPFDIDAFVSVLQEAQAVAAGAIGSSARA